MSAGAGAAVGAAQKGNGGAAAVIQTQFVVLDEDDDLPLFPGIGASGVISTVSAADPDTNAGVRAARKESMR